MNFHSFCLDFLSLVVCPCRVLPFSQAASQHSSVMLTTEGAPNTADQVDPKTTVEDADMSKWTEAEFEEKCTYIVKDHTWDGADKPDLPRAQTSLPRNLAFSYAPDCKEVWL